MIPCPNCQSDHTAPTSFGPADCVYFQCNDCHVKFVKAMRIYDDTGDRLSNTIIAQADNCPF